MLYEAFYDYLRGEAARSAHTVTAYRHDVESLRGFLKGARTLSATRAGLRSQSFVCGLQSLPLRGCRR